MKSLTICILLLFCSCERTVVLSLRGTNRIIATEEYIPLIEHQEPPYIYHDGWFVIGEIYNVVWNDSVIIATRYPRATAKHEYYIIYARDSIIVGSKSATKLGPLTECQKDSVVAARKINLSKMKEVDFN